MASGVTYVQVIIRPFRATLLSFFSSSSLEVGFGTVRPKRANNLVSLLMVMPLAWFQGPRNDPLLRIASPMLLLPLVLFWSDLSSVSAAYAACAFTGFVGVGPAMDLNCSCSTCQAAGVPPEDTRAGCMPDLRAVPPDIQVPPMVNDTAAAGRRVRMVAPGFEHTRAYHPLYLPSDWQPATATAATAQAGKAVTEQKKKEKKKKKKYPIIVEYMGNGPFNDKEGDISTGRPEDSNLGWGMAEPAGTKYIWISMPMLSADLVCENASFGAIYI